MWKLSSFYITHMPPNRKGLLNEIENVRKSAIAQMCLSSWNVSTLCRLGAKTFFFLHGPNIKVFNLDIRMDIVVVLLLLIAFLCCAMFAIIMFASQVCNMLHVPQYLFSLRMVRSSSSSSSSMISNAQVRRSYHWIDTMLLIFVRTSGSRCLQIFVQVSWDSP